MSQANDEWPDFRCKVCNLIYKEPLQCPSLHTFCTTCVTNFLNTTPNCPIGSEALVKADLTSAGLLNYVMSRVETDCPYASAGCLRKIELREFRDHEENCFYNPDKIVACAMISGKEITQSELSESLEAVRILNEVLEQNDAPSTQRTKLEENQCSAEQDTTSVNEEDEEWFDSCGSVGPNSVIAHKLAQQFDNTKETNATDTNANYPSKPARGPAKVIPSVVTKPHAAKRVSFSDEGGLDRNPSFSESTTLSRISGSKSSEMELGLDTKQFTSYHRLIVDLKTSGKINNDKLYEALMKTPFTEEMSNDGEAFKRVIGEHVKQLQDISEFVQDDSVILLLYDKIWFACTVAKLLGEKGHLVCPGQLPLLTRYLEPGTPLAKRITVVQHKNVYHHGYPAKGKFSIILSHGRIESPKVRGQLKAGGVVFDFKNSVEFTAERGLIARAYLVENPEFVRSRNQFFGGTGASSVHLSNAMKCVMPGDRVLYLYRDYAVALCLAAALETSSGKIFITRDRSVESDLKEEGLGWLFERESLHYYDELLEDMKGSKKKKKKVIFDVICGAREMITKETLKNHVSPFGGIVYDLFSNKILYQRRALKKK